MLDNDKLQAMEPVDLNLIEQRLWEKVHDDIKGARYTLVSVRMRWIKIAAAAVVAGVVIMAGYLWMRLETPGALQDKETAGMQYRLNGSRQPLEIALEDGSHVTLQPGASLSYPVHFNGQKRDVTLKGNGFFTISKNASKPFYVYSNDVIIKVLGTSFTVINNTRTHKTEVTVQTGSVAVSHLIKTKKNSTKEQDMPGIVIRPNQRVIYDPGHDLLESTLAVAPIPVITHPSFIFNDSKVSEVLKQIETAYGISIDAESKDIDDCTFTGDITAQGLYDKIDLVCKSIGASYQLKGTVIYIISSSKNCR
jgi:mannose-6-phosphate isomerase-like protein (cupin superfamily)